MALAINLLALVLVLGICWVALMWYTRHSKRHAEFFEAQFDSDHSVVELEAAPPAERDIMTGLSKGHPPSGSCVECEGVGAKPSRGTIAPCPICQGTGVS